jgi:hypothetical protein
MNILVLVLGIGAVIVIAGVAVLLLTKGKGKEEKEAKPAWKPVEKKPPVSKKEEVVEEEEEEEDFPGLGIVIEETKEGCPDEIRQRLLAEQQRLFKEAHKIYLVINQMFKNKQVPPEIKKDFDVFLRSYGRLKEMKEEIEVYPFNDCDKVFQLKFNFYNKLIKETAQKLMVVAKKIG